MDTWTKRKKKYWEKEYYQRKIAEKNIKTIIEMSEREKKEKETRDQRKICRKKWHKYGDSPLDSENRVENNVVVKKIRQKGG